MLVIFLWFNFVFLEVLIETIAANFVMDLDEVARSSMIYDATFDLELSSVCKATLNRTAGRSNIAHSSW